MPPSDTPNTSEWNSYQWPALAAQKEIKQQPLPPFVKGYQPALDKVDGNINTQLTTPDSIKTRTTETNDFTATASHTALHDQTIFEQGVAEGRRLAEKEMATKKLQKDAILEALQQLVIQRQTMVSQLVSESISELGFEIACNAFGALQKPSTEGWAFLIKAVFEELKHTVGSIIISVNPSDLTILKETLSTLNPLPTQDSIELVEDTTVNLGSLRMTRGHYGAEYSFSQRLRKISESLALSYDQF